MSSAVKAAISGGVTQVTVTQRFKNPFPDKIDAIYTSLFRELLTYMMEDPRNITFCTHLLFCAKNIERIGDHTTNIAETIHYLVTGDSLDVNRPKLDTTNIEVEAVTGN